MKVKTHKAGVAGKEAFCTICDWDDYTMTANSKARYHAGRTGHRVKVFVEHLTVIKTVSS